MKSSVRIHFKDISKQYALYGNILSRVLGGLGIKKKGMKYKQALTNINITIKKGEKVGIIGRNGSGKTTLLKLIIGFIRKSSGNLLVKGNIQSMMQGGYGFVESVKGKENVRNALIYNGYKGKQLEEHLEDIIEFVELGDFINHPISTYSLGMRARLEFATATAIKPDILVIDEVLGAGDGYFIRKCANRMRNIIDNSTLILVSHSMSQIIEYCERVVWLDNGEVKRDGKAKDVIVEYEDYMHDRETKSIVNNYDTDKSQVFDVNEWVRKNYKIKKKIIEISSFSINNPILETGDELILTSKVNSSESCKAEMVVMGFTIHGAFIFELISSIRHYKKNKEEIVIFRENRTSIGVGEYMLIAVMRKGDQILSTISDAIKLYIKETNWSDPPLLHINAEWHDSNGEKLKTKMSAWV